MIVPIPLPLRGLTTVYPDVPLDSGYARELTNVLLRDGRVKLRPSCRNFYSTTTNRGHLKWFSIGSSASNSYGIINDGTIYRLSGDQTPGSIGGIVHDLATSSKHVSIELVFGLREPRLADYPFTAWNFTTIGIAATEITTGCSHKGRLFVTDGSGIEYSELGAVAGPMFGTLPISANMAGQEVVRMFSATVQQGLGSDNVLAVFGNGGRVLIYSGEYPDHPNWQLVGKFDMEAPNGRASFVQVDEDVMVGTGRYCYWLRDLFAHGPAFAHDNRPSAPIENLWQRLIWYQPSFDPDLPEQSHAFYIKEIDAIAFQCSEANIADRYSLALIGSYFNEGAYLVYFREYKAWALWLMTPLFQPTRLVGQAVVGTDYHSTTKYMSTSFITDRRSIVEPTTVPIEATWKTPYLRRVDGQYTSVKGVRPQFLNTSSGYLHRVRAILDYSDYNAPWGFSTQSMVSQIAPGSASTGNADQPANQWGHYRPLISLGGSGGGVSFEFNLKKRDDSAGTESIELYGATAYIEGGGTSI
jgi:hypothetical protein